MSRSAPTPAPFPQARQIPDAARSNLTETDLDAGHLRGLDPDEARAALARSGPNELPPPSHEALARRSIRQLREPMALLLITAAMVDGAALGEWLNATAILVIVLTNTVIALVEEGRATRALDSLKQLETPIARVRRADTVYEIPARDLVVGDVVLLDAGNRVPADLLLHRSASLETDESTLTGESTPVAKSADSPVEQSAGLADRPWMTFSGTLVTRGTAEGRVCATGPSTVIGGLAESLSSTRHPTPLQIELRHVTVVLGVSAAIIAICVASLIAARGGVDAASLENAFLAGVALAVAAVPEGLATVTAVGLALGVRRMARQGAIVRRLLAVETLGSATTLALDKTGTLTENRMRLEAVITADGATRAAVGLPTAIDRSFARVATLCSEASVDPPSGDPLERALLASLGPSRVSRLRAEHRRLAELPFDTDRRRMTVAHDIDGVETLLAKGAPEAVIEGCATGLMPDGLQPLTADARAHLLDRVNAFAGQGFRTLALAERSLDPDEDVIHDPGGLAGSEHDLTLVAIAVLRDPLRAEAAASIREAREAGIHLLMVTGDHPGTALAIASEAGLAPIDTRVVTGADMRVGGVPDDPLAHPVYARVDPDQKLQLVRRLRARGEVVGMTGDGVNDAPSLRAADIGVALGASGTDVARDAADMVITDDNLATIVGAMREGRGVYDNIRKVVDYLVAGNLSEIAVVVIPLLLFPEMGVPLLPLQLLWINLLTDGLPAVALGLDPVDPSLMRMAPRAANAHLLAFVRMLGLARRSAALAAAAITALITSRFWWDSSWQQARVVMFSTLVATHLLYAFAVRRRPGMRGPRILANWWLVGAVMVGLLLQVTVVTWAPMHSLFDTMPLSWREWGLVALLATAASACVGIVNHRSRALHVTPS